MIRMIDDLKYIHEKDAQDALGLAERQWQQYQKDFGFAWQPEREISNVVIAGMGGSGLAAKVFAVWPGINVPITVTHDYELPRHVSAETLLICSSYSGNTEETLSVFHQAINDWPTEKGRPMVVVVASGGKLLEQAIQLKLPHVTLPTGYQPRMTLGYQLRALVEVFEQTPLLSGGVSQLEEAAQWLEGQVASWTAVVPAAKNPAKQLAQELMGRSPVVYAGPKLYPAAYKWKISFNENAKNVAWCNQLPEFNHNEFLGWTSHPIDKPYAVIDLHSKLEHERVQKRFEVTDRLLSGKRPAAHVVKVQGDTLVQQLIWAIAFGDFVSIYLALLNGLNPTPVDLIEKLKGALEE